MAGHLRAEFPNTVDLFSLAEHVVIAGWLGLPVAAAAQALPSPADALAEIGLPEVSDHPVEAAAVAKIVLERIQERLPQASRLKTGNDGGDELLLARQIHSPTVRRNILLNPVFLFAIDWALTAPGLSWPCDYHCTWIPLYDRYVVTFSNDTDEVCGVADIAVGSFGPDADMVTGALQVIGAHWTKDRAQFDQECWEAFLAAGAISRAQVEALADEVWAVCEEEDLGDWEAGE